ncbi:MAG: hypothetical protein ACRDWB_08325, partial [Acidimicrobiales bacterium]
MSGPNENDDENLSGEPLSPPAPPPPPSAQSQPGNHDPTRLRFDGVVLAGSIELGRPTAEDLTLLIDEQGVDVVSRQPPDKRRVPWSTITRVWCGPTGIDSSGRITTPLDITSANRTVRFYLYGDQVDEQRLVQLRFRLSMWPMAASGEPPIAPPLTLPPPPFEPAIEPPSAPPAPPLQPHSPPTRAFPPPGPPGWTPTPTPWPQPLYGATQPPPFGPSPPFALVPPPPFGL